MQSSLSEGVWKNCFKAYFNKKIFDPIVQLSMSLLYAPTLICLNTELPTLPTQYLFWQNIQCSKDQIETKEMKLISSLQLCSWNKLLSIIVIFSYDCCYVTGWKEISNFLLLCINRIADMSTTVSRLNKAPISLI